MPEPADRKAEIAGWVLVAVAIVGSRFVSEVPKWILLGVAALFAAALIVAAIRGRLRM